MRSDNKPVTTADRDRSNMELYNGEKKLWKKIHMMYGR